jgi:hypothetical protein
MSAFMTCHLTMDPLRHLHRLPSSTAGFRSTFDRLPYGCLLFTYRLDLTFAGKTGTDSVVHIPPYLHAGGGLASVAVHTPPALAHASPCPRLLLEAWVAGAATRHKPAAS